MNDHLLLLEPDRRIVLRTPDETPCLDDERGRRLWWYGTPPVEGIPSPQKFRERIEKGHLTGLCPPWAAVLKGAGGEPSFIVTDSIGLQHFYCRELPDRLVFSPSALDLASLAPFILDHQGCFELLTVGNPQGDRTLFEEVDLVAGATLIELSADGLRPRTYWRPAPLGEMVGPEAVRHFAEAVRKAVEGHFEAGSVQELTAGKDSMLLLAAARRCGIDQRYWTMGLAGDCDVVGARKRARSYSLGHQTVLLEPLQEQDTRTHRQMAEEFLQASNGMLNAFQYAFLPWVLRQVEGSASISGGGGEIFRGFFYEWGDLLPGPSRWNDSLMIHGKIRFDMPLDHPVLRIEEARAAQARLSKEISAKLRRYPSRRHALDCYYASDRMHFFGGATVSATGHWKRVRSPLLAEEVLQCLGVVPLELRAGSRLITQVIDLLLKGSPARPEGGDQEASPTGSLPGRRLGRMAGKLRQRLRDRRGSSFDELRSKVLRSVVEQDPSLLAPDAMLSGAFFRADHLREMTRQAALGPFWPKVLGGIVTIEWAARSARRLAEQSDPCHGETIRQTETQTVSSGRKA